MLKFFKKPKSIPQIVLTRQLHAHKDARALVKMVSKFQKEVFEMKANKTIIEKSTEAITHNIYKVDGGEYVLIGFLRFSMATTNTIHLPNYALDWLYIHPKHRMHGYGKQAVLRIIEHAEGLGIQFYTLPKSMKALWFFKSITKLKQHNNLFIFN